MPGPIRKRLSTFPTKSPTSGVRANMPRPRGSLRQSADVGGVAHEASRHERLQVHDAIQEEKDDGDENGAAQKVPVGKDAQVGERFAGLEFPHDKRDKRDDGNRRERANEIGVEPVVILSLVEDGLASCPARSPGRGSQRRQCARL